jgi:mono/diheme cytochrome c family protein
VFFVPSWCRVKPQRIVLNARFLTLLSAGAMLSACLGLAALSAQQKRTTWDGLFTDAQAERGARVYAEYCANCHGPDFETESFVPLIIGPAYVANWEGLPFSAFFDRVRSMPTSMELTRQQDADVVAFWLARNGFPSGPTELKGQSDELAQITFSATRP